LTGERRTRFDAYAAGLAAGEADRAAGLTEPREDVWKDAPSRRAPYVLGYHDAFGDRDDAWHLPEAPLVVDVALVVGDAFLGAWAARGPSRWSWRVWVAGGVLGLGWLKIREAAQRSVVRRRAGPDAPPPLHPPGRLGQRAGLSLGWALARRRGLVGDGAATRLGRNLAALVVSRLARRSDERAWNERRPHRAAAGTV
jgi:hypothetical protein